jgi:hypothetical protein
MQSGRLPRPPFSWRLLIAQETGLGLFEFLKTKHDHMRVMGGAIVGDS